MGGLVVAAEPAKDEETSQAFLGLLRDLYGLDGEPPLCSAPSCFVVAHKHRNTFCLKGYAGPSEKARPAIRYAEERESCAFRRSLEDLGFLIEPFEVQVPA